MQKQKRDFPPDVAIEHPFDLESFLPYRIHQLALRLGYVGEGTHGEAFNVLGSDKQALKVREWRLMVLVACLGPLTNSEIAELGGMEPATVSRAAKSLTEAKLVMSRRDSVDKRKTVITLTKSGARLFDQLSEFRQQQVAKIESCLTPTERQSFYRLLNKLDKHARLHAKPSEDSSIWG